MMKKYNIWFAEIFCFTALVASLALAVTGAASALSGNAKIGLAQIIIGICVLVFALIALSIKNKTGRNFIRLMEDGDKNINETLASTLPIPAAIINVDGTIRWYNGNFAGLFDNKVMYGIPLDSVITDIRWGEILKSASDISDEVKIKDRNYVLGGSMIKDTDAKSGGTDKFYACIYFIDNTDEMTLAELYANEHTDIAFIIVDNYDDVMQRLDDSQQQIVNSQIRGYINSWAAMSNAVVKKLDRDRYFMLFEHQYLKKYIATKFDIVENVRSIGDTIKFPISVSIGIGIDQHISDSESSARIAIDMTQGRGGDQVCVKDTAQYSFYGGKVREYEKSTRVKTRAVAMALKDMIKNSDNIILMSHKNADYDSLGSALGLQRAIRSLGRRPYIIYDNNSPAIRNIYTELKVLPEYHGIFIDSENASEYVTKDTLLIILDTNRPSMLPDVNLLTEATKIVLIDHHRRTTEFISPCSLVYHEPYASSTCEMVTELLEYMDFGGVLNTAESECLYTGILMDTKNFMVKTGVRTFEAASYLKRLGLNTMDIKRMFNTSKADYDNKADIVKTSVEFIKDMSVAKCYRAVDNIRVVSSQAADDMLNIGTTKASFVVYKTDNGAGICARSLGDINVQLIMERLGGGGHTTVAGAQIADVTVDDAVVAVENAAKAYLKDNV